MQPPAAAVRADGGFVQEISPVRVVLDPRQECVINALQQPHVLLVVGFHRAPVGAVAVHAAAPQLHTFVPCLVAEVELLGHEVQFIGREPEAMFGDLV